MIRYILDTDHLSLIERKHPRLKKYLDLIQPDEVAITIISAEEQLRGRFQQIRRFNSGVACVEAYQHLRETIARLKATTILDFDAAAEMLDQYLRRQKPRLGTQDRRIAAITSPTSVFSSRATRRILAIFLGLSCKTGRDNSSTYFARKTGDVSRAGNNTKSSIKHPMIVTAESNPKEATGLKLEKKKIANVTASATLA